MLAVQVSLESPTLAGPGAPPERTNDTKSLVKDRVYLEDSNGDEVTNLFHDYFLLVLMTKRFSMRLTPSRPAEIVQCITLGFNARHERLYADLNSGFRVSHFVSFTKEMQDSSEPMKTMREDTPPRPSEDLRVIQT